MADKTTTRLPYTAQEDDAIRNHISKHAHNEGERGSVGGNVIWKEMETKKVTPHSWRSMKDRYIKHICKDTTITTQKHSVENQLRFKNEILTATMSTSLRKTTLTSGVYNISTLRHPYSPEEDDAIVNYVVRFGKEYGERGSVKGNAMWKEMEDKGVTSHTWQSMKDRYLKHLQDVQLSEQPGQLVLHMDDGNPIFVLNAKSIKKEWDQKNTDGNSLSILDAGSVKKETVSDNTERNPSSVVDAKSVKKESDKENDNVLTTCQPQEEPVVKTKAGKNKRRPLFSHKQNFALKEERIQTDQVVCKSSDGGSDKMSQKPRSSLSVYDSLHNNDVNDLVDASASLSIHDDD